MFNSKKIKELETKIDLILDHLGLEYMPRLVEKVEIPWEEPNIKAPDLSTEKLPRGMKEKICKMCGNIMIIKKMSSRQYCDHCKAVRLKESSDKYEAKNIGRQKIENDTKSKICKDCHHRFIVSKSSHRQYCNKCKAIRRKATARKSSRKYEAKRSENNIITNQYNAI